ncbi:MAG: T9SS type A sorting domain-containing protein [Bacteroidetes bacterium]|nr:T9SS type A sorting domain-containing protein [Bacteroidota bacterium]
MRSILLIILFIFLSWSLYGQYQIKASVFGNGDANISNNNFRISSTIGQTIAGQSHGGSFYIDAGFWHSEQILTHVREIKNVGQKEFRLEQNYPNPFNPSTTIKYTIPIRCYVEILVFDILGRKMNTLVNELKEPGMYQILYTAKNLSSGVYFYRIQAGDYITTKKFILVK